MNSNINEESNFLQCYICMMRVRKPRMCPHCSKLACLECLTNWVQQRRNQCPHCRRPVTLSSFADCERFIDDLTTVFKRIDKAERPKQNCDEHGLQMQYYCTQCEEAICSDCGMFGQNHRLHPITHLNKIYESKKSKILSELSKFDQKIQMYNKNGQQIRSQIRNLQQTMTQKKGYLQTYFTNILSKLEIEFRDKQLLLQSRLEENDGEVVLLQNFKEQILENMQAFSQNEVILKTSEIIDTINEVYDKQILEAESDPRFQTMFEIIPEYYEFQYRLQEYSVIDQNVHYSKPYLVNGIQWRLKIYPKGNGQAKDKCLSVFLEMTKGYENDVKYQYKIELLNLESSSDSVLRQYSSKFDIGQCWGYNQFIELETLMLTKGYLVEDSLHFKIYIRNPNYKCLCNDQKKYISKLETQVKELEKLLTDKNLQKFAEIKPLKEKEEQNYSNMMQEDDKIVNLKTESLLRKQQLRQVLLFNNEIEYELIHK